MKRILVIIITASVIYSCKDNTQQEKSLLNEILKVHDKIMNKDDEVLMKDKDRVDSLLKATMKDSSEKVNAKGIDMRLTAAGEAMEDWMGKFQPDMSGKSHDEVMKYYTEQKKQVTAIDSQINVAIKEANQYLSTHKIK
jgi:hypothetical protein